MSGRPTRSTRIAAQQQQQATAATSNGNGGEAAGGRRTRRTTAASSSSSANDSSNEPQQQQQSRRSATATPVEGFSKRKSAQPVSYAEDDDIEDEYQSWNGGDSPQVSATPASTTATTTTTAAAAPSSVKRIKVTQNATPAATGTATQESTPVLMSEAGASIANNNIVTFPKPFKNPSYKFTKRSKPIRQMIIADRQRVQASATKQIQQQQQQQQQQQGGGEGGSGVKPVNVPTMYWNAEAGPSTKPQKKYCDITGLPAKYTDPKTMLRYHSAEVYSIIKGQLSYSDQSAYLALRGVGINIK